MTETSREYRKLELEALQQAARTENGEARTGLMQYAELWRSMAEEAEQAERAAKSREARTTLV